MLRLSQPRSSRRKQQPDIYLTTLSVIIVSPSAFTVTKVVTSKAKLLRSCVPLLALISRGLLLITPRIERFNQTLLNIPGTLEDDQKSDWKSYVPSLVHAYNSTRHESTGYSTHYLMFGRHPRLPVDAFLGIKPGPKRSDKSK